MAEGEGRGTARTLADRVGASLTTRAPIGLVHVLTHRRLVVSVYEARIARAPAGTRLVSPNDLTTLGVTTLTRKIVGSLPPPQVPGITRKRRVE
jgi:hypothetical protein